MLTYVAVMAFILSTSLVFSGLTRKNVADFIPISIFLAAIWVTIFGLVDKLLIAAILLLPLSLGVLLFLILRKSEAFTPRILTKKIFSLPIVFFLSVSAFTFLHSQNMQFWEWDEFTHWGPAVKSIFLYDVLSVSSPITLNNPTYPPGLAIVSYLIVKVGGVWDEADVIWAYQLIYISLFIPILGKFNYKKIVYFFFSTLILLLSSLYFYHVFKTIYADPLLGLVFGFSLYLASREETVKSKIGFFNYLISIVFLVLIKDFGIVLALASILIVCANAICLSEKQKSPIKNLFKLKFRKFIYFGIISLVSVFGMRFAWSTFVSNGQVTSGINGAVASSPKYFSSLFSSDNSYLVQLKDAYFNQLFNVPISTRGGVALDVVNWIFILLLFTVFYIFDARRKEAGLRNSIVVSAVFIGIFAWLFVMFILYLNFFGLAFSSYERYMSAYFCGMLFFIGSLVVLQIQELTSAMQSGPNEINLKSNKKLPALLPVFTSFLLIVSSSGFALDYFNSPNQPSDAVRAGFAQVTNKIRLAQFTVNDRIGIIAQHTMGFEYYVIQYEVMPASVYQTGFYTWSIGSPGNPGDVWTNQDMTPALWDDYLDNIDYLIVNNVSDSFIKEFGYYFDETESFTKEPVIYRVVRLQEGNRLVKYI